MVYDFKVSHAAVAPTGIIINPPMLDLVVGQTRQLSVTTIPSDAAAQEVTYSSDNTAVATVNAEGVVTAISRGSAAILATSTDGKFTSTCQVKVVGEAFGPNLALNKTATTTSTHDADHEIANLVDGLTSTRWSVSGYPQTATIDMGAEYTIGRTELVCYKDRDYQFTVSVATEENGEYTQVVDRSDNQIQGAVAYPIIDEFTGVKARYVKLTITGADAYTGTWMSLMEFRVFGEDEKVSLDELSPYQEVKLWPNPAKNIVHFYGDYDFESVLVYDYQGVLVMHQEGSSTSLNIQSLNSGLYVLKFYGNDKIRTSRLLKQ
ncbi:Ig-like domain-containing protein [Bacteroidia bacterium]|nr:Ig-like domain-containing protein [Bacteroidia bacterium]